MASAIEAAVQPAFADAFKMSTLYLASAVEAVAGIVIAIAVIEATIRVVALVFKRSTTHESKEEIRLHLGRWLALSLEFLLAADVLRTAVAPTWNEIGQLAAIVVLRTALNYFLQREIDQAAQRENTRQENARRDTPTTLQNASQNVEDNEGRLSKSTSD